MRARSNTISKHVVILLMAMQVFGFSLGSLVNFHLNRIYGNPLETELLFIKKDEKSVDQTVIAPVDLEPGLAPDNTFDSEAGFFYVPVCRVITHVDNTSQAYLSGIGLRAPPLA